MMLVVGGSFVVIAAIRLSPIAPHGLFIDILISLDCLQDLSAIIRYATHLAQRFVASVSLSLYTWILLNERVVPTLQAYSY